MTSIILYIYKNRVDEYVRMEAIEYREQKIEAIRIQLVKKEKQVQIHPERTSSKVIRQKISLMQEQFRDRN